MEGINVDGFLRLQQEEYKKADEICRTVFAHNFRKQFQQNIIRRPLQDGMISVSRFAKNPVESLFSADPLATTDEVLDVYANEQIKEKARQMVTEYQHLYDIAFLFVADANHVKSGEEEAFLKKWRKMMCVDTTPGRNPVVCKVATSYESLIGGLDQFMKQTACLAKIVQFVLDGCEEACSEMILESELPERLGHGIPKVLMELYYQWNCYHQEMTTDDGRVVNLPNTLIVNFVRPVLVTYLISSEEKTCASYIAGHCVAKYELADLLAMADRSTKGTSS